MKKYIVILVAIFTFLTAGKSVAQVPVNSNVKNYIVLTRNIKQLKPIILAAEDLAAEDGSQFGKFKVIICGKTITNVTQMDKMAPYLEMAEKNHVELYVCGLSLKKFKIAPKDMPKQIHVTKNGLLYDFQLQKEGYMSIEL
ncbi:DsrE family protein [Prolixibacter sp. NT017]|uniref:DsrE family protein n=1 Tax=Prolixibacter sp. NT017 TaxID=2652390 RepID=UPI0012799B05|nr:DsrE family protein [Prolixibacter sp. NT017]GET24923.1 hypothetical protein NT017_12520 [Prolixibacter sp. NT017]